MPTPYTRVVAGGTFGPASSPYEIFSFSFGVNNTAGFLTTAEYDAVATEVSLFFGGSGAHIGNRARLRTVKFHHLDSTWHQDEATYTVDFNVPGADTASARPSQVALAVSLKGPPAVHPVRGRFYLPAPCHTLDVDTGLLSEAAVQETADAALDMVTAVQTAAGAGGKVVIASKGAIFNVWEVRVGRVLDTIRSRRNDVLESYVVGV